MRDNNDILNLVQEKEAEVLWKSQRALILQPGAIGDCILTLPLVKFMKEQLGLGAVDLLGHTEYIGILPGRTIVDSVRSMENIDLQRLFVEAKSFHLPDRDPLINFFAEYSWVVTFLGDPGSNFEKNLIFTIHCNHSAEVVTLSFKPPERFSAHLSDFYIQELAAQSGLTTELKPCDICEKLITVNKADVNRGRELLTEAAADLSKKIVIIQPGSGGRNKCWHIDNFLAVAKKLSEKHIEPVFLLGPAEQERFDERILEKISGTAKYLMNLSLPEVVGLLSSAGCFIGNDSGITHISAGLGIQTISVFGPSNPNIYKPVGPKVTILRDDKPTFATEPSEELQRQLLKLLEAD